MGWGLCLPSFVERQGVGYMKYDSKILSFFSIFDDYVALITVVFTSIRPPAFGKKKLNNFEM